jgi:hypothetical protein
VVTNPFAAFRPPTRIGRAGSVPTPAAGLAMTAP